MMHHYAYQFVENMRHEITMKECRLVAKVAAEAKKLKKKTFFEKDVDRGTCLGYTDIVA